MSVRSADSGTAAPTARGGANPTRTLHHGKDLSLRLAFCGVRAARYAVTRWHYSKTMPVPPRVHFGVWERGRFIGVIIFSRGASSMMGMKYGLRHDEYCELTRVALADHRTPTTRIVSIALKMLKAMAPGIRLVVSFADPNHGHSGGIYHGGGWLYAGRTPPTYEFVDRNGRRWHSRQVTASGVSTQFGSKRRCPTLAECQRIALLGKHRFLMAMDDEMRTRIEPMRKVRER